MATHSSVLAWRIPGTGEPGGLLSMGSHRVGDDWSDLAAAVAAVYVKAGQSPWIICFLVQNCCRCSVAKSCPILCDPMDCYFQLNIHSVTERCISTMKTRMLFCSLLPFQLHASDLFLGTTFSGIHAVTYISEMAWLQMWKYILTVF